LIAFEVLDKGVHHVKFKRSFEPITEPIPVEEEGFIRGEEGEAGLGGSETEQGQLSNTPTIHGDSPRLANPDNTIDPNGNLVETLSVEGRNPDVQVKDQVSGHLGLTRENDH
jgi:hypothetical protein